MPQLNTEVSYEDPSPAATTTDQNAKLSTGMPCQARGCFTFLGSASSSNKGLLEWQAAAFLFSSITDWPWLLEGSFLSKASGWSLISSTRPHCIIKPKRSVWDSVSLSWGSSLTETSCSLKELGWLQYFGLGFSTLLLDMSVKSKYVCQENF